MKFLSQLLVLFITFSVNPLAFGAGSSNKETLDVLLHEWLSQEVTSLFIPKQTIVAMVSPTEEDPQTDKETITLCFEAYGIGAKLFTQTFSKDTPLGR